MKVYKYGLQAPTFNADLVREQMKKGHNYQNKLIEIECWRRDEVRKLESQHGDIQNFELDFQDKKEKFLAIDQQIKKQNSNARKKVNDPNLSIAKKQAKEDLKKSEKILREARKNLRDDPTIKLAKEEVKEKANEKIRELRSNKSITPWYGTYMCVEKAFDLTKKMPYYKGTEPNNPRFKKFNSGRIGIQQLGENDKELAKTNKLKNKADRDSNPRRELLNKVIGDKPTSNQIQIVPLKKDNTNRKIGNKDLRVLRVRIGTDEKKNPVWAEFPMVYHRAMQGNIISIEIIFKRIGPREVWNACITCDAKIEKPIFNNHKVAVDLGWRSYSDRIVIATYQGSDGSSGEISVGNDSKSKYGLLDRLKYVDDLKSIRDKEFDKIKIQLVEWCKKNESIQPDWFKEEIKTIYLWKSKARLSSFINKWSQARFDGDDSIIGEKGVWNKKEKKVIIGSGLLGWKYHDFHLWNLETSLSVKVRNQLKEHYRVAAAKLASQYDAIIFENIDGSTMAKGKVSSRNRQLTSPFEFRSICKMIFTGRDKEYQEVDAKYTSMECNDCHYVNEKIPSLEFFCKNCSKEIHRDFNAAKNILDRACATNNNASAPAVDKSTAPLAPAEVKELQLLSLSVPVE